MGEFEWLVLKAVVVVGCCRDSGTPYSMPFFIDSENHCMKGVQLLKPA